MMDFRKKLFIIIGLALGLIIALVLFLLYFRSPEPAANGTAAPNVVEGGAVNQQAAQEMPLETTEKAAVKPAEAAKTAVSPSDFYVKQLSVMFVERFLSYSNQGNNQHLSDVSSLVTEKMDKWIMTQQIKPGDEYQGVNTTVVASSVKTITTDKATVLVGVQRVYEGKENKTEYKDGRVELVKVGQEWKVDGLYFDK